MKNKIKIIDILCYISTGDYEKLPRKISYGMRIWKYDSSANKYFNEYETELEEWMEGSIFDSLNDEVEILDEEDEFEDIKEIPIPEIESNDNARILNVEIKLDQLIRNQKKIIERLNNERD